VSVTVDAASPLATVGGTALVQKWPRQLPRARISQEAFSALTATCTHEGCTITNVSGQTFICPCHGSQFSTSGSVVKSPGDSRVDDLRNLFYGHDADHHDLNDATTLCPRIREVPQPLPDVGAVPVRGPHDGDPSSVDMTPSNAS
jgi:nitrite reductase/ring-hydroxylating ferredoxin subunit